MKLQDQTQTWASSLSLIFDLDIPNRKREMNLDIKNKKKFKIRSIHSFLIWKALSYAFLSLFAVCDLILYSDPVLETLSQTRA